MHYYRPTVTPTPAQPYNNFKVVVPNDIFSIASALAYLTRECKSVRQPELSPRVFYVLTIRTSREIQENILGAIVE